MCNSTGKGRREKGLRRCLLPHCPRLTANNKNVLPSTNVTSYYRCLVSYVVPRAFLPRCISLSLSLFLPFRLRHRDETPVYKTPTRTYSAQICMESISPGNRVTSAHVYTRAHVPEGKSWRSSASKISQNDVKTEVKYGLGWRVFRQILGYKHHIRSFSYRSVE